MPTSKNKLSEDLANAAKKAMENGESEFEYDGKTYKVSDFEDLEEAAHEEEPTTKSINSNDGVKAAGNATKKAKQKGSTNESRRHVSATGLVEIAQQEAGTSIVEDVDALFSGEDLTEEFKTKASIIFESAVSARVEQIAETLEEEANRKVEVLAEEKNQELAGQVDDYLTYVAEEWMKENQIAVERGIRTDVCESFMSGLKSLFEAHHIDMPEEKVEVLSQQQQQINNLTGRLNEEISKNATAAKQGRMIQEAAQKKATANAALIECEKAIHSASYGLADTEVEKLRALSEGIDFDTVGQFKQKLSVIKESYFGNGFSKKSGNVIDEEDTILEGDDTVYTSPNVAHYANYLSTKSDS